MSITALSEAVASFARTTATLPAEALGRERQGLPGEGVWRGYADSAREVVFQVYQELREFAALVEGERAARGPAPTAVQRILARHQRAYRDLHGVLAGVGDDLLDQVPKEGEWPLRTALLHLMHVEYWGFHPQICHAVARRHAGEAHPAALPKEAIIATYGDPEDILGRLDHEPLPAILAHYDELHDRVLREFAGLRDDELDTPSLWWEGYPVPVRFRLHRFDAHLREHIVQIEKTFAWLGHQPTEAQRLARLLYTALGDAEGALIGADGALAERQQALATSLATRAGAIAARGGA